MRVSEVVKKNMAEGFTILLGFFVLIPYVMVLLGSIKSKAEAADMNFLLPEKLMLIENYSTLLKTPGVVTGFVNSLVNTTIVITGSIIVSSFASFIIQRRNDRISKAAFSIFLAGMVLPYAIIPAVMLITNLHIPKFFGMIIIQTVGSFCLSVFMYVGYFKGIQREIDESALMDGCGVTRMYWQIIFPLLKPITSTLIIIQFMSYWNDFSTPIFFLNNPKKYTLTLTLFHFAGEKASDWNLLFADIVLISSPVLILYVLLQKHIIAGLTAGAIKG